MGVLLFISTFLFLSYAVLILFYRSGWLHLNEFKLNKNHIPNTKVSIIIPARNEEHKISFLLKDILSQYYPTDLVEVIVIDDHSTDQTKSVVDSFKGVHCISLQDHLQNEILNSYKKKAIEIGIAKSSGELIITTDADCSMNAYWILSIVQFFETFRPTLIASPVAFDPILTWFDRFQSLDFMTMQGITGAVAQTQSGAMCNGANLAYTKEAFYAVGGFSGIDDIASGDDMLLMYKMEKKYPKQTRFLKCKDAIVNTETMPTIRSFFEQRIRWASKARKFKDIRIKSVLLLVYLFNLIYPVLILTSLFKLGSLGLFVGFLLAKIMLELYFLYPVSLFFKKQKELISFSILQFVHIPYLLISGLFGQFGTYKWKDRKVK